MFLEAFTSDASLVDQSLAFHTGTFCQRLEIDAVLVSDLKKQLGSPPPFYDEQKTSWLNNTCAAKMDPGICSLGLVSYTHKIHAPERTDTQKRALTRARLQLHKAARLDGGCQRKDLGSEVPVLWRQWPFSPYHGRETFRLILLPFAGGRMPDGTNPVMSCDCTSIWPPRSLP